MTKMMTAIALAAFMITPAAASATHKNHSTDSVPGLYMQAGAAQSAFNVVGVDNRVRRDPDPNIRVQLYREYFEGE